MRRIVTVLLLALVLLASYLALAPVPIDAVAWQPPESRGYTGPFARNGRLGPLEALDIGDAHGPEDLALDAAGRVYAATHDGRILRIDPERRAVETLANTAGRPLGIELDASGRMIVADAMRGLLAVDQDGVVRVLADRAAGVPIRYADDLDIAPDGKIYFSDASTKFGAKEWGGTYPASLLDINEHRGHGRLLVYEPKSGATRVLLRDLQFANGVAVSHDGTAVLVNETGNYRVLVYWLSGPKAGRHEPFIENLPGFPDNISRGLDGRYWVALVSPRNALFDALAGRPFLREVVQRLPAFVRPKARPYGHVIALDAAGRVRHDLQQPAARYLYTSVSESREHLYLGSLDSPVLHRVARKAAGLPAVVATTPTAVPRASVRAAATPQAEPVLRPGQQIGTDGKPCWPEEGTIGGGPPCGVHVIR